MTNVLRWIQQWPAEAHRRPLWNYVLVNRESSTGRGGGGDPLYPPSRETFVKHVAVEEKDLASRNIAPSAIVSISVANSSQEGKGDRLTVSSDHAVISHRRELRVSCRVNAINTYEREVQVRGFGETYWFFQRENRCLMDWRDRYSSGGEETVLYPYR